MKCKLLKALPGNVAIVTKPATKPSKKPGFDAVARATTDWHHHHADDNARIAKGVVLATGTIKPRFTMLVAINAKAKAWHEDWNAKLAEHALALAVG